jgi:hypothetical protein
MILARRTPAVRDREIREWRKKWDAWINDPAQANLKFADFPLLPGEMTLDQRRWVEEHRPAVFGHDPDEGPGRADN